MSGFKVSTVALCCLLAASFIATAQTTGNIRGTVTDETGSVLPGANVTITSPALIGGPRSVVTNEIGVYRFPSLQVGTYVVEVSMSGFATGRVEDVRVGINTTATVNVTMQIATLAETVTVTGESPVLDITKPGVSSSFTAEMVEGLPTNRNFYDLMQMAPGISATSADGQSSRVQAFGSGNTSNAWNVDGIEVTSPDEGTAWWFVNADMIEEVQVMGVGAPAEYGNATGAVLNVVTKGGGNEFHGGANFFFQHNALTDDNVISNGFGYNRKVYRDLTAQLGGPISKDKIWFFGAFQYWRDGITPPAVDPVEATVLRSERYDFKISAQLTEKHRIDGMYHNEIWTWPSWASPYYEPSALGQESGTNPAWKAALTSAFSDTTLMEIKYAGWWGDDIWSSATGSTEEPFVDYSPPGGGPTTYSGGLYWAWDWIQKRHQVQASVTQYAEEFLGAQHDFKFGVQYGYGSGKSRVKLSETGSYIYHYTYDYYGYLYEYVYRGVMESYSYGGTSRNLGLFVDDSITIGDQLTLNLGVRYDKNGGDLLDSERMTPDFVLTGEVSPGRKDVIDWNNISPRIGFAFQPTKDGTSVIRGSFGIYYDQNVTGNWQTTIEERPIWNYYAFNPATGDFDIWSFDWIPSQDVLEFDIKAPRSLQYSIGYERQLSTDVAVGVQFVYKETTDLIGWNILGGSWEPVSYTDPFTGTEYTLLRELEPPVLQKGNGPEFPDELLPFFPEKPRYQNDYRGLFFTFKKRFSNRWGLSGSYTWSRSEGLTPTMRSQSQGAATWGSMVGSSPNDYINAKSLLQADRPHMLRAQGIFQLPGDFMFSTSLNIMSGRPFNRQARIFNLGDPGGSNVIMEPTGSRDGLRHPFQKVLDVRLGKSFALSDKVRLKLDGTLLNVLNDDASLSMATLRLREGEDFEPDWWLLPRRLMVLVGVEF